MKRVAIITAIAAAPSSALCDVYLYDCTRVGIDSYQTMIMRQEGQSLEEVNGRALTHMAQDTGNWDQSDLVFMKNLIADAFSDPVVDEDQRVQIATDFADRAYKTCTDAFEPGFWDKPHEPNAPIDLSAHPILRKKP